MQDTFYIVAFYADLSSANVEERVFTRDSGINGIIDIKFLNLRRDFTGRE